MTAARRAIPRWASRKDHPRELVRTLAVIASHTRHGSPEPPPRSRFPSGEVGGWQKLWALRSRVRLSPGNARSHPPPTNGIGHRPDTRRNDHLTHKKSLAASRTKAHLQNGVSHFPARRPGPARERSAPFPQDLPLVAVEAILSPNVRAAHHAYTAGVTALTSHRRFSRVSSKQGERRFLRSALVPGHLCDCPSPSPSHESTQCCFAKV